MALRRCAWCGTVLGVAPHVEGEETHGVCDLCAVRLEAEAALAHALVGVRAIAGELERAIADVWKTQHGEGGTT
ncbi:MAG TPA: hypothetical protein VLV16_05550 [Gemmatimonadales bacterium]|nr:hypothetical protein [Gemmatimonadales bacterium]